jgi:hypothetical protein
MWVAGGVVVKRSEPGSWWMAGEPWGSSDGDGRPDCNRDVVEPGLEAFCGELDCGGYGETKRVPETSLSGVCHG